MKKNVTELTDEQVESVSHEQLKELYRVLREHHIKETRALYRKLELARKAYDELLFK